jgi:hypothetical protein
MQNINSFHGDQLKVLPFDKSVPTHNELVIMNSLFKQKHIFDKILINSKDLIILAFVFVLFSLPQIEAVIKKYITITNNSIYILIAVKALLFIFLYFIISNIHLARK